MLPKTKASVLTVSCTGNVLDIPNYKIICNKVFFVLMLRKTR